MQFFTLESEAIEICRDLNMRSQFNKAVGYVVTEGPTSGDDSDDSMDWCVMELEEAMENEFVYAFIQGELI